MEDGIKLTEPMKMSDVEPYIHEAIAAGGSVRVLVKGSSMYPFLVNGRDSVFFEALPQRALRSGDILLYRRTNGQYVMHRLYAVAKNGSLTFVGDNQSILEKGIRPEQLIASVNICIRRGKMINCSRSIRNRLMILYMKMRIRLPKTTQLLTRAFIKLKHIGG